MTSNTTTTTLTGRRACSAAAAFAAFLFFWALLLPTPAPAQNAPQNAQNGAASRGLLWEVRGQGCTAWLLGSVHVADESIYPLSTTIENAYRRADVLAVEADVTAPLSPEAQAILESAVYPEGQSLDDDIPQEQQRDLAEHGIDLSPFRHMRPWFAIMAAMQGRLAEMGLRPDLGIDLHFLERAHGQGKPVVELEGMARQLRDIQSLVEMDYKGFVHYTLQDLDRLEEDLSVFLKAWKTGDEALMEERLFMDLRADPGLRPFFEKLFFERNVGMARKVEGYLASGRDHLVVVGSGHLVGERSVVDLLRRAGYDVRRL